MAHDDKPASSKPSVPPPTTRRPSMVPQRPTKLGRFDVLGKIAVGGMASIYLGRDAEGGATVALKVMKPEISEDDELVKMFVDEASLLAKLHHPNIVHTIDFGVEGRQRYIAMELLLGMPLSSVVEQCTARSLRLDPDLVAYIGARIAEGLHHAHELHDDTGASLSLIHRDVNPANVFVTFDGHIKLFDFGMARTTVRTTSTTSPGVVKGKLPYLAPEQIMQLPLDRRADIFGLGTSLWELLTMQRLFHRATDVETVRAVHVGPIPDVRTIVPEVPARFAAIVGKALERNREHRYPSAEALARDLAEIAAPRAANAPARLGAMLDSLFPTERKRQAGWLKPAISGSGGSKAPPPMR
ncbi:MAG: serine/threonine protein kinase [Deltaproteobacteria bacterium]|nr:serine/threonine protein kinase [Deltaproteobacteria bacterium]